MPLGGTSYQPGATAQTPNGAPRAALSPQEAVRILSLRLPKNPQNSPIPSALLNSAGGGATSNLTQLLQMLMQAQAASSERPGGDGTREMVEPFGPPAQADPIPREEPRSFAPRIRPGAEAGFEFPPPAPTPPVMEDTPLFDQGIPGPIRQMPRRKFGMDTEQPLF